MADIIINADDFGFSENTVEATIKLFESKVISSATIMLSMPGTEIAIDYAKKNPQFSFGLHLNLITDDIEKPILQSSDIPTLTTRDGFFHSDMHQFNIFINDLHTDPASNSSLFKDADIPL